MSVGSVNNKFIGCEFKYDDHFNVLSVAFDRYNRETQRKCIEVESRFLNNHVIYLVQQGYFEYKEGNCNNLRKNNFKLHQGT